MSWLLLMALSYIPVVLLHHLMGTHRPSFFSHSFQHEITLAPGFIFHLWAISGQDFFFDAPKLKSDRLENSNCLKAQQNGQAGKVSSPTQCHGYT